MKRFHTPATCPKPYGGGDHCCEYAEAYAHARTPERRAAIVAAYETGAPVPQRVAKRKA